MILNYCEAGVPQEKLPTQCEEINKYIKKLSGASKYILLMS